MWISFGCGLKTEFWKRAGRFSYSIKELNIFYAIRRLDGIFSFPAVLRCGKTATALELPTKARLLAPHCPATVTRYSPLSKLVLLSKRSVCEYPNWLLFVSARCDIMLLCYCDPNLPGRIHSVCHWNCYHPKRHNRKHTEIFTKQYFRYRYQKCIRFNWIFLTWDFGFSRLSIKINLLKPTGHVMHQQFNIQQL